MNFLSDVRYAIRVLARNPGFAVVVVSVLGLGIGGTTTMLTIVDAILLRPLSFRDPSRLVAIQESTAMRPPTSSVAPVNAVHFLEWLKQWHSAEDLALLSISNMNLTTGGDPERIVLGRVSWSLFPMLGIQPTLGRNFSSDEDKAGSDRVVVISDALWERRFHRDPAILGRTIALNDVPFEVVGVLPPGLQIPKVSELQPMAFGSETPQLWKPFGLRDEERAPIGDFNYACIARLKPGVSLVQASAELNAVQANISRTIAENVPLQAMITPLQEQITGRARQGLVLMLLSVAGVLMIVCVNVANLLLVRAAGRRHEFAVRAAIGAGTSRLVRQALTESLVMAVLGGLAGIAIAIGAVHFIVINAPAGLPRVNEIHTGAGAIAIAFALALMSAAFCGVVPAWLSSRFDPQHGLRVGGRAATDGKSGTRWRTLLVGAETALCTLCLVTAGLLLNSFVRLLRVDTGFNTEHVISVALNMPAGRYPGIAQRSQFLQSVIEGVRALPGVTAVGVSNLLPLAGEGSNNIINVDGDTTPFMQRPIADFRLVNEDFFNAMGVPVLEGRPIEASDRTHRVSVISEALARRLWPNQTPLGKQFRLGDPNGPALEVIGIAGDVRGVSLQKNPNPTVYLPYWQRDRATMSLIVRTEMNPAAIASPVRDEIHRLDPEMPAAEFRTLDQVVADSVAMRRFQLALILLFGGLALCLAALGIYGVVSHTVAQRRNEMGIRMALGATGNDLKALVIRQGLAPVVFGLVVGFAGTVASGRLLNSLLFGVAATDSVTLGAVAVLILSVAVAACYIPAARATRTDPLTALRCE
jgi:putative ABC transport system permease protein